MSLINPILSLPAPLVTGIQPLTAKAFAFAFSASYVGSLYVAQRFFLPVAKKGDNVAPGGPAPGHRDHPATMRLRMRAVQSATGLCLGIVFLVIQNTGRYSVTDAVMPTLRLLGLSDAAQKKPLAYILAPTLFIGPLYAAYLDETLPGQRNFHAKFGLPEKRNYIIGPFTEELVFRSAMIAVSLVGHQSTKYIVFATPLWFGIAHVHHAFQLYRQLLQYGSSSWAAKRAILSGFVQTGYTTLFGWFAAYLYIRTGSVLPPLVSHVFCNYMGIDLLPGAAARHPGNKISLTLAFLSGIAGFAYGITKL